MNTNTLEKLGYNQLKETLKNFCISGLGKNLIDNLKPLTNIVGVKKRLNETSEAKNLLNNVNHIPFDGIHDITSLMNKIQKGSILEPNELINVSDFLRGSRRIKKFMMEQAFYAPTLSEYALALSSLDFIEDEINGSIKNNKVDSSASKDLFKIRKKIFTTEENIQQRLNKVLLSDKYKKYIQDFHVVKRNDRYTIPIKSSYKNKIDGAVIDVSSKGTTVFIEPTSICKYNEELTSLKYEEKAEEYQILAYLTGMLYEEIQSLNINIELISQYDMIFAKGKYSNYIDGVEPKINFHGYINIIKGRHPLLKEECIPLDFHIGNDYRTLVITGPNAGGKTVALKTIGLLTLAAQSGLHISASKGSSLSIFDNIFVDIGDNQSIENALSTFSSHMKNISQIVYEANNSSLVLFDEIGTGTEPNEGAGLAIAILEELYHMGCITIATTHYSNIKDYAYGHPEFENAYMRFNPETLEPLYEMVIGKGGDSNALWISRKMGLKEKILNRAKTYINTKEYNYGIVDARKIRKEQKESICKTDETINHFRVGDKVRLLDTNEKAIVYKEKDKNNNIEVMANNEFKSVNIKRVNILIKKEDLYPEGYDINSLFTSYESRKLEKDIKRGSKKALKKIQKDIKNRDL
ncbi:endonuclease MutS2 [Anaeromicrobium sediminis]|uniref:Mannonate oxidoreductase n=1 Tax=Anaeromicrobium sediminis TaxID=1478221 RepID=A0A267MNR3_9FIRM|nr:mannonate oxidoreductase [Anaeromicrobium sediminis]PAB61042.1 mannonate oxidoreductase [Anaeromicrobium sediminis]